MSFIKEINQVKRQAKQKQDTQLQALLNTAFETHKAKIINCAKKGGNSYYFSIPIASYNFKNKSDVCDKAVVYFSSLGFQEVEIDLDSSNLLTGLIFILLCLLILATLFLVEGFGFGWFMTCLLWSPFMLGFLLWIEEKFFLKFRITVHF